MDREFTNRTYTYENITLSLVCDSDQLDLFERDRLMNNTPLKYPRRSKRSIANNVYQLDEPTEAVSSKMQKVLNKNTGIEQIIEQELIIAKIKYTRPQQLIETVEGNPDFVVPRYKIAIFCDGDFWHGYNFDQSKIKSNSDFWAAKIERNIVRDEEVTYHLKNQDWQVFRFWEHEIKNDSKGCVDKIKNYVKALEADTKSKFTFVDLFAGIGGFRIPLEELGGKCLGFSEIDKPATEVYKSNFFAFNNEDEVELGDITKLGKLPFDNLDLLVGGVPCQAWSVAGKMRGFDDPRGKLWLDTIRVVSLNKPKAFVFENVKGLIDPRNTSSLNLIIDSLEKEGYKVKFKLLNSYDFGLPQNRDRIFIVGFRDDFKNKFLNFDFPEPTNEKLLLNDIIDGVQKYKIRTQKHFDPSELFGEKIPVGRNRFQNNHQLNDFFVFCDTRNGHTTIHSWDIIKTTEREKEICLTILKNRRKKIYGPLDGNPISFEALGKLIPHLKESELSKLINKKILRYVTDLGYEFVNSKNSAGINGIYRIYLPHSKIFSTLTATGTKDMIALEDVAGNNVKEYKENFINNIVKKKLYKAISPKEAGKLQGFPSWFAFHKDEKLAKKQFGNAVSTSVIFHLSKSLLKSNIFEKKY